MAVRGGGGDQSVCGPLRRGRSADRSPPRPAVPRLHVLADDDLVASPGLEDRLAPLAEAGGPGLAIQLRARTAAARRVHEAACRLVRAAGAVTLVSDRVDIGLAAGAGGVHLREDSMPVEDAKALVARTASPSRTPFLVGRSIHVAEQAAEPWAELADYLVFGAVWATRSHPGRAAAGIEALAAAVDRAPVPVLAIGGVTPEGAAAARAAGAWGVVVRSGVWRAANAAGAAIRYLETLG